MTFDITLSTGRHRQSCPQGGFLLPLEGLHSLLLPSGSPHSADLHLLGADEQELQGLRPRNQGGKGRRPVESRTGWPGPGPKPHTHTAYVVDVRDSSERPPPPTLTEPEGGHEMDLSSAQRDSQILFSPH